MKNKKKLTLDSFKEKAESVATNDILEKVQGGDWFDCHNCSSTWEKARSFAKDLILHPAAPIR